jgi:hypothetical protein
VSANTPLYFTIALSFSLLFAHAVEPAFARQNLVQGGSSQNAMSTSQATLYRGKNFIGDNRAGDIYKNNHQVGRDSWDTYRKNLQQANSDARSNGSNVRQNPQPNGPAGLMTGYNVGGGAGALSSVTGSVLNQGAGGSPVYNGTTERQTGTNPNNGSGGGSGGNMMPGSSIGSLLSGNQGTSALDNNGAGYSGPSNDANPMSAAQNSNSMPNSATNVLQSDGMGAMPNTNSNGNFSTASSAAGSPNSNGSNNSGSSGLPLGMIQPAARVVGSLLNPNRQNHDEQQSNQQNPNNNAPQRSDDNQPTITTTSATSTFSNLNGNYEPSGSGLNYYQPGLVPGLTLPPEPTVPQALEPSQSPSYDTAPNTIPAQYPATYGQ